MASHHLPYSQRRAVRQLGFLRPINCALDPKAISGVLSREILLGSYTGVSMDESSCERRSSGGPEPVHLDLHRTSSVKTHMPLSFVDNRLARHTVGAEVR